MDHCIITIISLSRVFRLLSVGVSCFCALGMVKLSLAEKRKGRHNSFTVYFSKSSELYFIAVECIWMKTQTYEGHFSLMLYFIPSH